MSDPKVNVRRIVVGPLEANCYLVWPGAAGDGPGAGGPRPCLVIDPGAEPEKILAALEAEQLRPEVVVATHCHGDHIGAAEAILEAFPEAVWAAGGPEAEWPGRPAYNLSYAFGFSLQVRPPARLLADGDEVLVGCGLRAAGGGEPQLRFKVLAVPGHSPGSVALYCEQGKAVFTGDALFAGDIGRADLPGGDEAQLIRSVRTRLLTLPDETVVWPGHANRSRVGAEKRSNPYVGQGG